MLSEPKSRPRGGVRVPIVAMKPRTGGGAKGGRKGEIVTNRQTEDQPEAVSARTIRAGEVRARWAWTEPTVWTERMLTALEEGVKGGVDLVPMSHFPSCDTLRARYTAREFVEDTHGLSTNYLGTS